MQIPIPWETNIYDAKRIHTQRLIERKDDNKIPTIFVLQAIKLGSYFLSHAKRMYSLAYKEEMPARSLAEKLVQLGVSFTRSQIRNKDWSNLKTAEQRVEAIQTLINRGYISEQTEDKRYITNPKHLDE